MGRGVFIHIIYFTIGSLPAMKGPPVPWCLSGLHKSMGIRQGIVFLTVYNIWSGCLPFGCPGYGNGLKSTWIRGFHINSIFGTWNQAENNNQYDKNDFFHQLNVFSLITAVNNPSNHIPNMGHHLTKWLAHPLWRNRNSTEFVLILIIDKQLHGIGYTWRHQGKSIPSPSKGSNITIIDYDYGN